ncbi:MAG: DUF4179 domain-containing protein [Firmicutes bacterium]|nr:DUF4179 domain-containing protein [Bacillota bacterium]
MNKDYRNKTTYGQSLDALAFSESAKNRIKSRLLSAPASAGKRFYRPARAVVVAVMFTLALAGTAVAACFAVPTLEGFYRGSAGYQQSAVEVERSVTKNGWTMTLTDCVMDEYSIYAGLSLTAPEGIALDEAQAYFFDEWSITFEGEESIGGGAHYEQISDGTPEDGSLRFILWSTYPLRDTGRESLDGRRLEISFGGLWHNGAWNEAAQSCDRVYDCRERWSFTTEIALPDRTVVREPDVPVTTLGVETAITRIEVTPIGVYIHIEGDALKGHHAWVPKNAPDGWYGCVEYQEVVLHLRDSSEIVLDAGQDGSGCSGGTDTTEPGELFLARRSGSLLDMDAVDYITVCGVDIPLR